MIKLPLYNTGPEALQPRYTVINVEDVYKVESAATGGGIYDIIHLFYSVAGAVATDFLRATISYTNGGATVVTDQDVENMQNMIDTFEQSPV